MFAIPRRVLFYFLVSFLAVGFYVLLAYLQNGDKAEAKSTLEHVLKLNPTFPAAADVRRALATIG